MTQADSVHSTPPPNTSATDCPVLALARTYDELARDLYAITDDSIPEGERRSNEIYFQLKNLADATSYLSPQTSTGAAFQIMLASAEADLTLSSASTPAQLEAGKSKIERLLYRALDVMQAEAKQLPHCRDYLMRDELDPARKGGDEPAEEIDAVAETVSASKPETKTDYSFDDLKQDVCHVYELLNVVVDADTNLSDAAHHERTSALAWVARDLVEKIKEKIADGGGRPR